MIRCPYCGHSNLDQDIECRKCQSPLGAYQTTVYKSKAHWIGPEKARKIRDKALSVIVLALLIKVYWGGYGPWPVVDNPTLASLRNWLEPILLYGGCAAYVVGWILHFV